MVARYSWINFKNANRYFAFFCSIRKNIFSQLNAIDATRGIFEAAANQEIWCRIGIKLQPSGSLCAKDQLSSAIDELSSIM
jgi:hypothetical protein